MDDTFHIVKKIGEGAYGIVYEIIDNNGNKYAYKRIMCTLTSQPGSYTESDRESTILSTLNGNPRIVKLKMVSVGLPPLDRPLSPLKSEDHGKLSDDLLHFIFENAHSNLRSWLNQKEFTLAQFKQLMVDILLGTESITLSGILHRDLNPSNILIFEPSKDPLEDCESLKMLSMTDTSRKMPLMKDLYRAKICDFGLAMFDVRDGKRTPGTVTPWYRAPEIIGEDGMYGSKSDAWSVGCIFYEMLFKSPFTGKVNDTKSDLVNGIFRNAPYKLSDYEIRKVLRCERKKQATAPKPIRPRMISSKIIRQMVEGKPSKLLNMNAAVPQTADQIITEISDVVSSLLIVDPAKRSSVSEVLDMPFFESHKTYIQAFRETYPPRYPMEYTYDIHNTRMREEISEYIISIFNQQDKYSWYTHRAFFHAIDLFDRDIRYHERINTPIQNSLEGELHFFCCLFRCIRFFSTLAAPIEITDILPNHLQKDPANLKRLTELEVVIILDVTNKYSFYRYGIYEAISELPIHISRDPLYREATVILTNNPQKVNGLTPTEFAHKLTLSDNK